MQNNNTQFIMLDTQAYNKLILDVTRIARETAKLEAKNDWITDDVARQLLGVGKTTLQKFRDEGKIKCSYVTRKNILYSRSSIINYIESKIPKYN